MLRRLALFAALLLAGTPAAAQISNPIATTSTVIGTFTVASLPPCSSNQGKYAFVTDLGGGADTVLCDGTYWKHIRLGSPASLNATSGTIVITPLSSAPVQLITNNVTTMSLTLDTVNLYPGYLLYVRTTGLVTETLGIKVGAQTALPILGNSTSLFIYDGTTLQRIQ